MYQAETRLKEKKKKEVGKVKVIKTKEETRPMSRQKLKEQKYLRLLRPKKGGGGEGLLKITS